MVPVALTTQVRAGSSTDLGTDPSAARWKTMRDPSTAELMETGSRMEPWMKRSCSGYASICCAIVEASELERSSMTVTRAPRVRSASTRCPPMNPAPPVTVTMVLCSFEPRGLVCWSVSQVMDDHSMSD